MKQKNIKRISLFILAGVILLSGAYLKFTSGRPAPVPVKEKIMDGVTYKRIVRYLPHPMIAHVLIIDKKDRDLEFMVTPPDDIEGGALKARTTSQFLKEFGVQLAINGDGFFPWWSRSPMDYYPHVGDAVTPNGFTASYGDTYADGLQDIRPEPVLYITRRNEMIFNRPPNKIYHALAGDRMLVQSGNIIPDLDNQELDPRTAIGINHNGRFIYLVVIDGRQPFYSTGATFSELADLLFELGAFSAMSLDGGGSSAMVIAGQNGEPVILNSPIDSYIPLRERPVANHFGVYVK